MKLYYSWKYRLGNKRFASTFIILGGGGGGADFHVFFKCFYFVVFLVHSYVFLRAFSGAVFPCFSGVFW